MNYKILHFSDLHLDTPFDDNDLPLSIGIWRRADLRATLGRILALARERKVDAVTIAGDLFDQQYAMPDTADFLVQQFERLQPIRVFIAPGDADSFTNDSMYDLTRMPDNVTVFKQNKLVQHELATGLHLWGAANPPVVTRQLLEQFITPADGMHLLLLHADDALEIEDEIQDVFLAGAAMIQKAGFRLALLGHKHGGECIPDTAPFCFYPGSPQPFTVDEASVNHTVILFTIQDGQYTYEQIPISQWHYHLMEIDLSEFPSAEGAAQKISTTVQAVTDSDSVGTLHTIRLSGSPQYDLDVDTLKQMVQAHGNFQNIENIQFTNLVKPMYNLKQFSQEPTIRGLLVQRFQQKLRSEKSKNKRNLINVAQDLALQALDGKRGRMI